MAESIQKTLQPIRERLKEHEDLIDEIEFQEEMLDSLNDRCKQLAARIKRFQNRAERLDNALRLIRNRLEDHDNYDMVSYLKIVDEARGFGEFA